MFCGAMFTQIGQAVLTSVGFVIMLNGAVISWWSKRQPTVALSSAKAGFISASSMVQEVIFLLKFLKNLVFPQTAPTPGPAFAYNEACIAWSKGSVGGSDCVADLGSQGPSQTST